MSSQAELSTEDKYNLLRSVGEECIQENELKNLVEKKPQMRCYDGFEPSGRMHIAQGVFKSVNVNKCTACGCQFVFWVADWFALMNDKVGGELEKIQTVGKYLIEVWKAAGMNMEHVEFLWASKEITAHANTYWKTVLDIGRRNTIARIKKCCTIMGKNEGTLTGAQILYPLMQCSDIFFLKADICQLGVDQRKVNMLAREYCDQIGKKLKPVILSHHMLSGLKQGQAKMSKSDPDSAIFMEDTAEDVQRKIMNAYCPKVAQEAISISDDGAPQTTDNKNPILDYFEHIVFSRPDAAVEIDGKTITKYQELENLFISDQISEESLKQALVQEINLLLEPVRAHFNTNAEAKQLLEEVKSYRKGAEPSDAPKENEDYKPADHPVACMWLPAVIKLPLNFAIAAVQTAKSFLESNPTGEVIMILPEWSAMACDEITGEEKDIKAALEMNVHLLQKYGLPEQVRVVKEEELILEDANKFWFTTINVGRKNLLSHIEELSATELKNAGQVIGALMRVSDAVLLGCTHVFSSTFDGRMLELVGEFTQGKLTVEKMKENSITALYRPDSAPAVLGADDVLYLDDTDMDIRRKIKKAYSAPNERENPIISIAVFYIESRGELKVERGEANGGDIVFTSGDSLRSDCESGALHPGDLKGAVSKLLLEDSEESRKALGDAQIKKLSQTLRNAEKKLAKRK